MNAIMKNDNTLENSIELRKKAEDVLERGHDADEDLADMSPQDIAKLVHELQVHQIELKMQNDELRRIQIEHEKTKDLYVHLYDFAPTAYFTVSDEGVVEAANLTAATLMERQRADIVGRMFTRFVLREDQDTWYFHRKHILETGDFQSFPLRLLKRDGEAFYVELQCIRVNNHDNEPTRIRISAVDITERKQMEEVLQKAHDELETRVQERTAELEIKNTELRDFTFIASHDLREPLRKVRTFGDMLAAQSEDFLGEVSMDYIRRMQGAAERMQNLLDSLLIYSRVSTEIRPIESTDLRKTVEQALSNLELIIEEKDARVEVGELPTVEVDRMQMVQVFQNLIGNALKFQRENEIPRIKIYTRKTRDGDGASEICVQDNGIGFEEKYLDKIFLPFQRLHGRDSHYQGIGMGLAICKKIVERHDGKITASSGLDKGSIFTVRLPVKYAHGRT